LFFVDDEDDHRCNVKQWIEEHFDDCNEQLTAQILEECGPDEFSPRLIFDK
jgi:hypothetical protein